MKEQPSYYAILTANVRYDNRLTDSEKLLFAEITALSNKYGYCTASNGYFAQLYNVHKVTISNRIKNLKKLNYLRDEMAYNGKEIKQRKLYPIADSLIPINANTNTPISNSVNTPINANAKENNTSINNTRSNNIYSLSDDKRVPGEQKIINEFNEWYDLYDNKKDRKGAITKFKAARKKHSFEEIMDGTKAYLKTITDKKYQKYPKTFLYNESYLDEHIPQNADEPVTGNIFDEMRAELRDEYGSSH